MLNYKIGFIGGGNMAQAIIGGLLAKGVAATQIFVSDPNESIRNLFNTKNIETYTENQQLVENVDIIVLAIKPQVATNVLQGIAQYMKGQLVISIMAGVEIATISHLLGGTQRVVRVMPNTPALVQLGANGAYAQQISQEDRTLATEILQATGLVTWVDEEADIDSVTAVSGSGPAYFFYMMEQMIKAGQDLGLSEETARKLTLQTALGAAQMAMQSELTPTELRKNVTSPNGTTQAAIETFDEKNVALGIYQGVQAAAKRSKVLAEQLRQQA